MPEIFSSTAGYGDMVIDEVLPEKRAYYPYLSLALRTNIAEPESLVFNGPRWVTDIDSSKDIVESVSAEDIADAQRAYDLFSLPKSKLAYPLPEYAPISTYRSTVSRIEDQIQEVGFDSFVNGFVVLRRLNGEDSYGGLLPVAFFDKERTKLRPYLEHASRGQLVISEWSHGHDVYYHLMGGLLATHNMSRFMRLASRTALHLPLKDQEIIGTFVDEMTYRIRNEWMFPKEDDFREGDALDDDVLDAAARKMKEVRELTGINHINDEDLLFYLAEQKEYIRGLKRRQLSEDEVIGL